MVNGTPVSPLEFCTTLLTSQQQFWYRKDERDVGYIRVEARGRKNGTPVSVTHTIIDYADLDAGLTSMQRLVGFTVAIAASLIANGGFTGKRTGHAHAGTFKPDAARTGQARYPYHDEY